MNRTRLHRQAVSCILCIVVALTLTWVWSTPAAAQTSNLSIQIASVDSQAFPQVTAYVIPTEDGLPLAGLSSADFQILENGAQLAPTLVAVESDTTSSLNLVLVLDTSMAVNDLVQVKAAAQALLDRLQPDDKLALIEVAGRVRVLQSLTDNKTRLQAAIASLVPGHLTAFNQAAFEAATVAGAFPPGRQAVIIVTDVGDNVGNTSADVAIRKAQETRTPIYTLGFGAQLRRDSVREISRQTGGHAFILTGADEVEAALQTLVELLRVRYKLTFQSGMLADDAEHDFMVRVTYKDETGQGQGRLHALSRPVRVSLPWAEGQTVGGRLTLSAQITASAPLSAVEYLLDQRRIGAVFAAPYEVSWDSAAVQPGVYHLVVRAMDRNGNQGQAQTRLNVVAPLRVEFATTQSQVRLGNDVTFEAQVQSLAPVKTVEFLLDGQVIGKDNEPPYRLTFNSSRYAVGAHVAMVRAQDVQGHQGVAELEMQFLALPFGGWRQALTVILMMLVVLGPTLAGMLVIATKSRRGYQKHLRLAVCNLSNVPGRFELQADDPSHALKIQFAWNGRNLAERQVVVQPLVSAPVSAAPAHASSMHSAPPPRPGVMQTASRAFSFGTTIADLLATVGYLLPGTLGAPLIQAGMRLRQGQFTVSRVERLQDQVTALNPAMATAAPTYAPAPSVAAPAAPEARAVHMDVQRWAETPNVEPGETLWINVLIDPLRLPARTQHYAFRVLSRMVEAENAVPVMETGSVEIKGVAWFYRHPVVTILMMAALAVLLLVFLWSNLHVLNL